MADSVTVADLPTGFDLYAGYEDGNYTNTAAIQVRFPGQTVVSITVNPSFDGGIVLDVENGDATPVQAPAWVLMRRKSGVDPTVYCSEAMWPGVQQAFANAGVPAPHYWIAGYPGSVGEALYPGSVAHQWIDRGPYDESIVADYWPGVDPIPSTPPTKEENDTVFVLIIGPQTHVYAVVNGVVGHWWQLTAGPDYSWHPEQLPAA